MAGNKGMGQGTTTGHKGIGSAAPDTPSEGDMSDQIQGNNQLQGNDQSSVHNQRRSMPGETTRTEGVVESFERMDPKTRAGR